MSDNGAESLKTDEDIHNEDALVSPADTDGTNFRKPKNIPIPTE